MKKILFFTLFIIFSSCVEDDNDIDDANDGSNKHLTKDELDEMYLFQWSTQERYAANTANNVSFLTAEEKEIFFYLNLVRMNAPLFANTYVSSYTGVNGWTTGFAFEERKQSLIQELLNLESLPLVYPDENLYELARCFALEGGLLGIMGHDRSQTSCDSGHIAECIQYGGGKNGLSIIMAFLIDAGENNANLGHRRICLKDMTYILGASIENHIEYQFNAVLDFGLNPEPKSHHSETDYEKITTNGIYFTKV